MSELWASFLENRSRICEKWAHYFPIYERHFKRFQNTKCTILEIGCGEGGSLQMWKRYFGPEATIIGIDINEKCRELEEDQIKIRIGDQADPDFLKGVISEIESGYPDVVIDDGSHQQDDIMVSFDTLYPNLDPRGVYLVEDLHTAYWKEFGGREGKGHFPVTFIDRVRGFIDELHAWHARSPTEKFPDGYPWSWFALSTDSIHVYDSITVFEKAPRTPPRKVTSGCFGEWRGLSVPK